MPIPQPSTVPSRNQMGAIGAIAYQGLDVCTGDCTPGAPCPTVTGQVEIRDPSGATLLRWEDHDIDLTLREMRTKETFEIGPDYCTAYWYEGQVDLVIQGSGGTLTLTQPESDYWQAVEAAESHIESWSAMSPGRAALEDYRQSLVH